MKGKSVNSFIAPVLVVFCFFSELAASEGIERSNYSISLGYQYSDFGNTLDLGAQARIPLTQDMGAIVSARAAEVTVDESNQADTSNGSIGLGLLWRNDEWGDAELGYRYENSDGKSADNVLSVNTDTKTLSAEATAYLGSFDLSVSYAKVEATTEVSFDLDALAMVLPPFGLVGPVSLELSPESLERIIGLSTPVTDVPTSFDTDFSGDLGVASAAYYLTNNLLLQSSIGLMDAEDSYSLSFTYQPSGLGNRLGISGAYGSFDDLESYGVSVSYFFNAHVSLMDRNRRY